MNVFTMRREYSSRYSPVQVGLVTTNNGSYPHEDTFTVTGRGGNGSGALRMRKGWDADRTWETGGEKETKETKIQECQMPGKLLTPPLVVPDTRSLGVFFCMVILGKISYPVNGALFANEFLQQVRF